MIYTKQNRDTYLLLVLMLLLSSCSTQRHATPAYEVEVITVEEQANEEINKAPLRFVLPHYTDAYAWERARLFFSEHTRAPRVRPLSQSNGGKILDHLPQPEEAYYYRIERTLADTGFQYTVDCQPLKSAALQGIAQRNAKNLSRFIRDGVLEESLLAR